MSLCTYSGPYREVAFFVKVCGCRPMMVARRALWAGVRKTFTEAVVHRRYVNLRLSCSSGDIR
jgi:hypothetical protein